MKIVLVGLNHRSAPVEIRECLALDGWAPVEAYREMRRPCLTESLFLSTCNRVEVMAASETPGQAIKELELFLGRRRQVPLESYAPHLYVHEGSEAVRHIFSVASSLDSLVVGEPQILGQLKDAFRTATEHRATGAILNKLLHKSFSVAKRVRTETGIASHSVSVGSAAVEMARKIFGELTGRKVLLIGAGEMAELAAEHLLAQGVARVTVANRTLARAVGLAQRFGGQAALLEEIPKLLVEVDMVISSTGAPEMIVTTEMVRAILRARKHRPLFFVDIAVPRDVDPAVNRLENVYLYDIDDLMGVVDENKAARLEEAAQAKRIVEEETLGFMNWLATLETFPTIVALRDKAEAIRQAELRKTLGRLGELSPTQVQALEVMTQSLTRKLIHDPIIFIKRAGRHGRKDFNLDLARRVLGLNGGEEESLELDEQDQGDENANSLKGH